MIKRNLSICVSKCACVFFVEFMLRQLFMSLVFVCLCMTVVIVCFV